MNRKKKITSILALYALLLASQSIVAQTAKNYTLSEIYDLAIANSKQLKVSQTVVETAKSATQLVKTAQLPSLDASFSALYIGNAIITDRNFSNSQTVDLPHFGNNFSIEASQVIFAGGAISKNIEKARLQEQIAQLSYNQNEMDICFLVTGFYLDLYKLKNQSKIFEKNIEETELLIQQIKSKEKQGMALSSDVTRHELLLQNMKLALIEVENNSKIINNQLIITLGLPTETQILPDSTILTMNVNTANKDSLLQLAMANLPELKSAALNKDIANKDVQIAKSDYSPQLAFVAANNFNGPNLIVVPALNKNFNYWYAGIGIKYNIASLYKTKQKIELLNKKQLIAEYSEALALEHTQEAVYTAYTKLTESIEKLSVYEASQRLADENYRVINNRYLNELVLITEMLDASNTKLNAELQVENAKLTIIYNYYKLQREIGNQFKK